MNDIHTDVTVETKQGDLIYNLSINLLNTLTLLDVQECHTEYSKECHTETKQKYKTDHVEECQTLTRKVCNPTTR